MPTIPELTERLTLYRDAEKAVLAGHQSYSVDGVVFTRADLAAIQREIRRLESSIATMRSGGGWRVQQVRF